MNNKIVIQTIFLLSLNIFNGSAKLPNKIHNGNDLADDEFKFEVSIRFMSHHLCAGSIISKKYVLTSASCVTLEPNIICGNLQILSGTKDSMGTTPGEGKLHEVSWTMIHPNYYPILLWRNDIALLKITPGYFFDETHEKVVMPYTHSLPKNIHVAGWGGLYVNNKYISKAGVLTFRRLKCKNSFGLTDFLHASQFCGVSSNAGSLITMGDSGNPIVRTGTGIIIGIVSAVEIFESKHRPMLATRVYSHRNFINKIIRNY